MTNLAIYAVLVPLVVGIFTALIERPFRFTTGMAWLAAVVSFFVAGGGIRGWPAFPPAESVDWLLYAGIFVGVYAGLSNIIPLLLSRWFRILSLLVVLSFPLMPLLRRDPGSSIYFLFAGGFVALVVWETTELALNHSMTWFPVALWSMCLAGGGIIIVVYSSLSAGSLAIATAVSLVPMIFLFMLSESPGIKRLNGSLVMLSGIIWFYIFLYVPFEWPGLLLISLAPSIMVLSAIPWFQSRKWTAMVIVTILSIALLVGGLGYNKFLPQWSTPEEEGGSYQAY